MASQGGDVSTSVAGKGKKSVQPREGVGLADTQKSIEKLNAREFRERFHVPYGIAIHFLGGDPVSTKHEPFNDIIFSKEKFNVELCFPLPSLFKQFFHFKNIFSAFLYLNVVRILMGDYYQKVLFCRPNYNGFKHL